MNETLHAHTQYCHEIVCALRGYNLCARSRLHYEIRLSCDKEQNRDRERERDFKIDWKSRFENARHL